MFYIWFIYTINFFEIVIVDLFPGIAPSWFWKVCPFFCWRIAVGSLMFCLNILWSSPRAIPWGPQAIPVQIWSIEAHNCVTKTPNKKSPVKSEIDHSKPYKKPYWKPYWDHITPLKKLRNYTNITPQSLGIDDPGENWWSANRMAEDSCPFGCGYPIDSGGWRTSLDPGGCRTVGSSCDLSVLSLCR